MPSANEKERNVIQLGEMNGIAKEDWGVDFVCDWFEQKEWGNKKWNEGIKK